MTCPLSFYSTVLTAISLRESNAKPSEQYQYGCQESETEDRHHGLIARSRLSSACSLYITAILPLLVLATVRTSYSTILIGLDLLGRTTMSAAWIRRLYRRGFWYRRLRRCRLSRCSLRKRMRMISTTATAATRSRRLCRGGLRYGRLRRLLTVNHDYLVYCLSIHCNRSIDRHSECDIVCYQIATRRRNLMELVCARLQLECSCCRRRRPLIHQCSRSIGQLKNCSLKLGTTRGGLADRNGVITIIIDHRDLSHFLITDLDLSGFIYTECDICCLLISARCTFLMKSILAWLYLYTASGIFCCPFGNLLASFKQLKLGARKEFSSYLLLIDRNDNIPMNFLICINKRHFSNRLIYICSTFIIRNDCYGLRIRHTDKLVTANINQT